MIAKNLQQILKNTPSNVQLVAVSKTKSNEEILEAYNAGQRIFGENRVQELVPKHEDLPKDIQWHMIGYLQTNKVKYLASFVALIHGGHSFKLLKEINKRGKQENRVIDVLIQFHIADEDTKAGFEYPELEALMEQKAIQQLEFVNIRGVMGMATFTDDTTQIRKEFKNLNAYFQQLKSNFYSTKEDFNIISMGMSGDYQIAIEEGSNMIRVGSAIFGERNYN